MAEKQKEKYHGGNRWRPDYPTAALAMELKQAGQSERQIAQFTVHLALCMALVKAGSILLT